MNVNVNVAADDAGVRFATGIENLTFVTALSIFEAVTPAEAMVSVSV